MAPLPSPGSSDQQLVALAVDDELPALSEMRYLLEQDPRVARVHTAQNGTDALRVLDTEHVDVIFSDINMPGLDGMELARVVARFAERPSIVFVTAHDAHAVDAFALDVADYVMKPVRAERLSEAIRRVLAASKGPSGSAGATTAPPDGAGEGSSDETIPVELGGVTRFVNRSDIRYVQAHGDYARLHTANGSHLIRIPLATLEERWAPSGFVRIHRSTLVSTRHIAEVRMEHGRCTVLTDDGQELQVSRRHTRQLRDRMLQGPGSRRLDA